MPHTQAPAPTIPTPPPATALDAGVHRGPNVPVFPAAEAARLWEIFRISCPSLTTRQDASGLTRPEDWQEVCAATPSNPAAYLASHFELVRVGEGTAFATGYYEPEIPGCRVRQPGCEVPIYRRPPDLLDANPATGERGRGRVDAQGQYLPYYDRAEIEDGVLANRGLELAWAADPVDLFFLQVQGSGRVRMADGSVLRIGYAAQNGSPFVAIGRLMRDRGIISPPISMQRIRDWIHANPDAGRTLMREDPSYVFFRELTGPGPLGALGRPVTPHSSVAADPHFVPLGAPVWLQDMDNPVASGLWVAQDTGGAIRGPNRFDTFWGTGAEAAATAGSMQSHGRAWLLLPRGAEARIRQRAQAQH